MFVPLLNNSTDKSFCGEVDKKRQVWWWCRLATLVIGVAFFIYLAGPVWAQNAGLDNLQAANVNLGNQDLIATIGHIINIILGVLGVVAVGLIIYAGFIWLTSAGNEEKIAQAKKIISSATIGLAIILASFAIASFIINQLSRATNGSNGSGGDVLCPDGGVPPCLPQAQSDYLIAQRTYPSGTGVSLCSAVQVQFNQSVKHDSLTTDTFRVVNLTNNQALISGQFYPTSDAGVVSYRHAGNDFAPNTQYQVSLTGGNAGIVSVNGLHFRLNPGKTWTFTTGTKSDNSLPTVQQVQPAANSQQICREVPIQIRFSKSMDAASFYGNVILRLKNNPSQTIALSQPSFGDNWQVVTFYPQTSDGHRLTLDTNTAYEVVLQSGANGITDACGNPLDGNANGKIDGAADNFTWSFTTGQTTQCDPSLSSVQPVQGDYGSTITLTGDNLYLDGDVSFNRLLAGNNSFDSADNILCWNGQARYAATNPLYKTCASGQIKVRVPVGAQTGPAYPQAGLGATNGPVRVEMGNIKSNSLDFKITSPYLDKLSPGQGSGGQFVSLMGYNFGDTAGSVKFISPTGQTIAADIPSECSDWWQETDITIKVPTGLIIGTTYQVQVTTAASGTNAGNKLSNVLPFTVTNDPVGPGICSLSPHQAAEAELPVGVEVVGEHFGQTASGNQLAFDKLVATNFTAPYSWTDTKIITATPTLNSKNALAVGRYEVCVTTQGLKSNCKLFNVSADSSLTSQPPRVIDQASCAQDTQSPSPYTGSLSCANALVGVRFNQAMTADSFNSSNIKIKQCGNGDLFDSTLCQTDVAWTNLQIINNGDGQPAGFTVQPTGALAAGYWYKGIVTSGVTSQSGNNLAQDYVWQWRIKPDGTCTLANLTVSPSAATVKSLSSPNNTRDYRAIPVADNCNILDGSSYVWQWSSSDISKATVAALSQSVKGRATALAWTDDQPVTIIAKTGAAPGKQGQANFYAKQDDTNGTNNGNNKGGLEALKLLRVAPVGNATNVCRNAAVVANFNRIPLSSEVAAADLVVRKICPTGSNNCAASLVGGQAAVRGSRIVFIPKQLLDSGATYQAQLSAGQFDCGPATPQTNLNLMQNGGFENGLAGWMADNSWTVTTSQAKSGSQSVVNSHGVGSLEQTIAVTSGVTYKMDVYINYSGDFKVSFGSAEKTVSGTSTGWEKVSLSTTASGNSLTAKINIFAGTVYLDDGQVIDSSAGASCVWTFTVGSQVCQISKVVTDPSSFTYSKAGQSQQFYAEAQDSASQPVTAAYQWKKTEADSIIRWSGAQNEQTVTALAGNLNGRAVLQVTADGTAQGANKATANVPVEVYLCEVPWQYIDPTYNFSLRYCRSVSLAGLSNGLPALAQPNPKTGSGDLLKEYILPVGDSSDVIGLRVYDNKGQLSPKDWYNQRTDINKGAPVNIGTINGYPAIQDGSSVYVNAVNVISNQAYSNIYVLSYNREAATATKEIFKDLINDWRFNTNLSSPDALKHDLQRLSDLSAIKQALADYYQTNNYYPKLAAGTYLPGRSVSTWPSWQSELANNLGRALPIDPINQLAVCGSGFDPATCWNNQDKQFSCPAGSHVYQYSTNPTSGAGYSLSANFEYKGLTWHLAGGNFTVPVTDECNSYITNN